MSDGKAQIIGRFEIPEGDALIRAQELKARKGRLTVTEAIQMLIDKAEFFNLSTAVKAGELFSYAPGSNKRLVGNTDNCSDDEELFPAELNAWLDANHPHVDFRFPEVDTLSKEANEAHAPKGKPDWVQSARQIGEEWMNAGEKRTGKRPTVIEIAKYVEGELSTRKIIGARGKFLDWETIKKEALTGITGRKKGDNFKSAMGNPQRRKRSPIKGT